MALRNHEAHEVPPTVIAQFKLCDPIAVASAIRGGRRDFLLVLVRRFLQTVESTTPSASAWFNAAQPLISGLAQKRNASSRVSPFLFYELRRGRHFIKKHSKMFQRGPS